MYNQGVPDRHPPILKVIYMRMADYILSVLRSRAAIVLSWGFHNCVALHNGLAFYVQGFLFTGVVKVLYDESSDTFSVRCEERDGTPWKVRQNVYFDELVNVIDELVEKCPDYENRVHQEYGFSSR